MTAAKVWIEVPHADDMQDLPTAANAEITWLVRDGGRTGGVLAAVGEARLFGGNRTRGSRARREPSAHCAATW